MFEQKFKHPEHGKVFYNEVVKALSTISNGREGRMGRLEKL